MAVLEVKASGGDPTTIEVNGPKTLYGGWVIVIDCPALDRVMEVCLRREQLIELIVNLIKTL